MTKALTAAVLVGFGGSVGSLARYGLALLGHRLGVGWPVGTFAANCLGCLVIGVIAEAVGRGHGISPEVRLLLATGFCGGFTTLSSMVYEAGQMLRAGAQLQAVAYVGLTLTVALLAFFAGILALRLALRLAGGSWS